jgi:hypothetical protein
MGQAVKARRVLACRCAPGYPGERSTVLNRAIGYGTFMELMELSVTLASENRPPFSRPGRPRSVSLVCGTVKLMECNAPGTPIVHVSWGSYRIVTAAASKCVVVGRGKNFSANQHHSVDGARTSIDGLSIDGLSIDGSSIDGCWARSRTAGRNGGVPLVMGIRGGGATNGGMARPRAAGGAPHPGARALHVLRAQGGAAAETRPRRRLEGRDKNGGGYVSRWQVRRAQAAGMAGMAGMAEMRCQVRRRRRRRRRGPVSGARNETSAKQAMTWT